MAKEQERKVELLGAEPKAFGLTCQCSATELQLPPATTPPFLPFKWSTDMSGGISIIFGNHGMELQLKFNAVGEKGELYSSGIINGLLFVAVSGTHMYFLLVWHLSFLKPSIPVLPLPPMKDTCYPAY